VFHVKHEFDRAIAEIAAQDVTPSQVERVLAFERLLRTLAVPLGLIAAGDAPALRERHVLDSARAAPHVRPGSIADLGSGAGLPGIVVAILRPDVVVHLVEAQRKRLGFLELAVDELELDNARPVGSRVEVLGDRFAGAVARAFADAQRTWRLAEPHLADDGELVYFAGSTFDTASLADRVRARIVPPPPLLASSGPLVIMSRQ
jgi:16S rRNA (guanine527-N7)-methyltransferase